jgi:hypothetical protein
MSGTFEIEAVSKHTVERILGLKGPVMAVAGLRLRD